MTIAPNLSLVGLYRWQSFVDAGLKAVEGTETDVTISSHYAEVGVRYSF